MEHTHNHNTYWKTEGKYTQLQYQLEDRRNMYTTTIVIGKDYGNVSIWRDGLCWDLQMQISNEPLPLFIIFKCY